MFKKMRNVIGKLKIANHKDESSFKRNSLEMDCEFDTDISRSFLKSERNHFQDYTNEIETAIGIKNINTSVRVDEGVFVTLERKKVELSNLKFLVQKLNEKNMMINVFSAKIELHFKSDNSVNYFLELELKTKGLRWAIYFSKYVLSEVNIYLKHTKGSIYGEYISNVSLGRDKYVIYMNSCLDASIPFEFGRRIQIENNITELDLY